MEVELRRGSDEGSRKLVVRFVLHEGGSDSSGKLSRLILVCLLVSSNSFPKKASCKDNKMMQTNQSVFKLADGRQLDGRLIFVHHYYP